MQGHSKEKCFCVVGYPSWHRLFGKPKPKPRFSAPQRTSAAHVAMTSSDSNITTGATGTTGVGSQDGSGINSHGLSDSQFNHLVQLLQNTMKSPSSDASPATWSSANTVHLAGTLFNSQSSANTSHWIVDSGATDHITTHLDMLINPVKCNALLHLPNGNTINVTHVGSVRLISGLILNQVLCVPGFTHNLLSISKLLKDTNLTAVFSGVSCYIQDPTWKRELEIGKIKNGLYVFSSSLMSSTANSDSSLSWCNSISTTNVTSNIWHARLGHVPASVLQQLSVKCTSTFQDCDSCHFSKQFVLPFPSSSACSTELFQLVHADMWGPYARTTR